MHMFHDALVSFAERRVIHMIERIEIQYFRSIYSIVITNTRDLNIFTGKNDVGKSNILRALNLFFNNCIVEEGDYQFQGNYNLQRLEEVRRDTIKGKQFIQVKLTFRRGKQYEKTLPEKFTVTKKWNRDSLTPQISDNIEQQLTKQGRVYNDRVRASLTRYLNRIKYIYVPAIKDKHIFENMLERLQNTVYEKKLSDNVTLTDTMERLFDNVIQTTSELSKEFRGATNIESMIATPNSVTDLYRTLNIVTKADGHLVRLEDRGDGIQVRYIPSILNYLSMNATEKYIWGFEEPENSLEYNMAREMAEDFYNKYKNNNIIFLTTHSPAFIELGYRKEGRGFRCYKDNEVTEVVSFDEADKLPLLEEELGYAHILKKQYEEYQKIVKENTEIKEKIEQLEMELLVSKRPVLLTEGKTDAQILNVAWEKLYTYECPFEIKSCDLVSCDDPHSTSTAGADMLKKVLCTTRYDSQKVIIGLFDNDPAGIKAYELDHNYCEHAGGRWKEHKNKKGYAFLLPACNAATQEIVERKHLTIEFMFDREVMNTEVNGKKLRLIQQQMTKSIQGIEIGREIAGDEYWYMAEIDNNTKKDFAYTVVPALDESAFNNFKAVFGTVLEILEDI